MRINTNLALVPASQEAKVPPEQAKPPVEEGRLRLTAGNERPVLPDNWHERLVFAMCYGRGYANRVLKRRDTYEKMRVIREGMERQLFDLAGDIPARMLWAAYWFGAEMYSREHPSVVGVRKRPLWGTRAQQELIRAFIGCADGSSRTAMQFGGWIQDRMVRERWWIHFAGATAVARVAFALDRIQAKVYLPKVEEDVDFKIDLLAELPGANTNLCIQLKSDGESKKTEAELISLDATRNYERLILEGVQKFRDRVSGTWKPVILRVGLSGQCFGDLYECWQLRFDVARILKVLVPDFG